MTTGPGDETAAAAGQGHGRLRASHADREQVIEVLKAAFVQGRLTKDELDARAGQAFTSRTYAELAAATADLPAGITGARTPRKPARPPENTTAKTGLRVIIAATAPTAGLWAGAWLAHADNKALLNLVLMVTFTWFTILLLTGALMLVSWPRRLPAGSYHRGQPFGPTGSC